MGMVAEPRSRPVAHGLVVGIVLRIARPDLAKANDIVPGRRDRIAHRDLESYLQARLKERSPATVDKERTTIIQFFNWVIAQGHLETSPATARTRLLHLDRG